MNHTDRWQLKKDGTKRKVENAGVPLFMSLEKLGYCDGGLTELLV